MKDYPINWNDEEFMSYYFSHICQFIFDNHHKSLERAQQNLLFIKELIFCSLYVLYIPHTRKGYTPWQKS